MSSEDKEIVALKREMSKLESQLSCTEMLLKKETLLKESVERKAAAYHRTMQSLEKRATQVQSENQELLKVVSSQQKQIEELTKQVEHLNSYSRFDMMEMEE